MQPINTAICSFGMSGWVFHAPFISTHPGFNFYGVWERTKNLAQERYPSVKTFRTLEEMLADEKTEILDPSPDDEDRITCRRLSNGWVQSFLKRNTSLKSTPAHKIDRTMPRRKRATS